LRSFEYYYNQEIVFIFLKLFHYNKKLFLSWEGLGVGYLVSLIFKFCIVFLNRVIMITYVD